MIKPSQLLDTSALISFVVITESDSLTDAARRLEVTQSAVSQTLKQLETTLGVTLIVRRTRPLRLTAAGQVLKQNADTILGDLRRLNSQVRDATHQGLSLCRLGLVTSCSEVFGSSLIALMNTRIDQLTLRSGLTPSLQQSFLEREVDILISNDAMDDVKGLERHSLFRDPLLLVLPKNFMFNNHLTHREALKNLALQYPFIRYGRNTHIGAMTEVALRRMGILTQVRYETDDTHTLVRLVKDGHCWGIISALCLAQVAQNTVGLRILPLDNNRHARDMYLIARDREMGNIPTELTSLIREQAQGAVLQTLQSSAPWLNNNALGLQE